MTEYIGWAHNSSNDMILKNYDDRLKLTDDTASEESTGADDVQDLISWTTKYEQLVVWVWLGEQKEWLEDKEQYFSISTIQQWVWWWLITLNWLTEVN